nr:uncharacterized protein LOC122272902 isoform X1 [Parasteatoda tepidariorum]XP_042912873.1 uncharacterized protein LOC122272902 isoform X2 [Parasteatoda tepidariorum]
MFKSAKKEDYVRLAVELNVDISNMKTIVDLITAIQSCDTYKNNIELVEELANNIIEERKSDEIRLIEKLKAERVKSELELAKLRIESKSELPVDSVKNESVESLDSLIKSVRTLTHKIPNRPEGRGYFFSSLERAFISKNVPEKFKAEILLNLLG